LEAVEVVKSLPEIKRDNKRAARHSAESLRLILISDIHMSNALPQATLGPDGVSDRLREQAELWGRVRARALADDAAAVLILGDLFDKSLVDAVTLTMTVEAIAGIAGAEIPVYILPGNHDAVSTEGGRFTVEAFGKMGNPRVAYLSTGERLSFPTAPWLGFWPMEYSTQTRARRLLGEMRAKVPDRHEGTTEILLLHQSILNCVHMGWKCDDGLDPSEFSGWDYTFSGHFHTPQRFGPEGRGLYLGAPMHHRMDDVGRKAGFWSVEFRSNGKAKRTFVDGECARFHAIGWEVAKTFEPQALIGYLGAKRGDFIRLTATYTHAEWEVERAAIDAQRDALNALGMRASRKHKPLYHHATRLKSDDEKPVKTHEDAIDGYLSAPEVDLSGLDPRRLRKFAVEAMSRAQPSR